MLVFNVRPYIPPPQNELQLLPQSKY